MFNIRADIIKNRLYITLKGYINDDLVLSASEKTRTEISKLIDGFDVITEISEFSPGTQTAARELINIQELLKEQGVNRIIRITGKNIEQVVSKIQFDRASRVSGIEAETAGSVAEADRMLDESIYTIDDIHED
ncbi:MAG: hypothetical protein K9L30_13200 [Desulfobacterales bacterium]|nr:hypothetical protein [Desulfobacterales bacterium]